MRSILVISRSSELPAVIWVAYTIAFRSQQGLGSVVQYCTMVYVWSEQNTTLRQFSDFSLTATSTQR